MFHAFNILADRGRKSQQHNATRHHLTQKTCTRLHTALQTSEVNKVTIFTMRIGTVLLNFSIICTTTSEHTHSTTVNQTKYCKTRFFFACPLFREFHEPGKFAKITGRENLNTVTFQCSRKQKRQNYGVQNNYIDSNAKIKGFTVFSLTALILWNAATLDTNWIMSTPTSDCCHQQRTANEQDTNHTTPNRYRYTIARCLCQHVQDEHKQQPHTLTQ